MSTGVCVHDALCRAEHRKEPDANILRVLQFQYGYQGLG